ncbi:hypothetical protein [Marinobacter sp.]|uniref:hypothetical protein n=1 Tax=uncultured Marinobacter sp. TaxID=187379 RepID=UPI002357EDD0
MSLGVTEVHPEEMSLKSAIKPADQGLYEAKETGRNALSSLDILANRECSCET